MSRPIMLELFSGTGRMSRMFRLAGWGTRTVEIDSINFEADLYCDIAKLTRGEIQDLCGGNPDFIWMSPPCEGFSVAALGKNWRNVNGQFIPVSGSARNGLSLLHKCLWITGQFPDSKWCIENPVGMMRKMIEMRGLTRHTITYCQYGETRMKPTDIWTNLCSWVPRPPCKQGDRCHEAAPRGSKTGTQGLKDSKSRASLPFDLCAEVAEAVTEEIIEHKSVYELRLA